ncbi:calphotin-like [Bicyclus anynana]|uniref:Calphotin-like n=1 Tax=Bicyclus anynana TaxID=110368 RepID=A0A6J1MQE2_BICAN|nr:calphotin-like [Bicyclus anynana]
MFKLVVLSVVFAVAAANPGAVWGAGLAAPWGGVATPLAAGWGNSWAGVATPWAAGVAAPWAAPIAAPLAAPVAAVAVGSPTHLIKKRSIVAAAPLAAGPWAAAPLAATPLTLGRSWVSPVAPVAVAAPIAPWGLGVAARGGLW